MKNLRALFAILTLVFLTSCGASLDDIETGMTEAEVEEILGTANHFRSNTESSTVNGQMTVSVTSTWTYEGLGVVEFQDGVVIDKRK